VRLRDGVLISYLRGERERDCKGHIWGVLGVFVLRWLGVLILHGELRVKREALEIIRSTSA